MIKHPCTANDSFTDLFDMDEFGHEKLVFCSNREVWED